MLTGIVAPHDIIRKRAPLVPDGQGGTERDWDAAASATLSGWAVDIGNTVEDTAHRDAAMVAYTIRGPLEADIDEDDMIVLFGLEYEIDGGVRRQPGPGPTSHTTILLKRWEG